MIELQLFTEELLEGEPRPDLARKTSRQARSRHRIRHYQAAMLKLPSGKEVDFVEGDALNDEAHSLVQVCLSMEGDTTRKREVEALREAMGKFRNGRGTIITLNGESEERVPEGIIDITPVWKWLLQDERG